MLCSVPALALNMSVATYEIPNILEPNRSGSYDKILLAVEHALGEVIDYSVFPPGRARVLFDSKKTDCILPFDADFLESKDALVQSDSLNLAKAYIFTKSGQQPLNSIDQLAGLLVGVRHGMAFGKDFDKANLSLVRTALLEQNIQLLNRGRIHAFVAYEPDIWDAFNQLQIKPLNYDPLAPIVIHEDSILCHETPKARQFIQRFNLELRKLKDKGIVKEILGDSYVAP